jgi:hypothetical protein
MVTALNRKYNGQRTIEIRLRNLGENLYIDTIHALSPKVADTFQIFLPDTHALTEIPYYQPINAPTAGAQAFLMDYT